MSRASRPSYEGEGGEGEERGRRGRVYERRIKGESEEGRRERGREKRAREREGIWWLGRKRDSSVLRVGLWIRPLYVLWLVVVPTWSVGRRSSSIWSVEPPMIMKVNNSDVYGC